MAAAAAPHPAGRSGAYSSAQATQADAACRLNEELRAEMVEMQQHLAHWTTEQKQLVDSTALQAQRTLEDDKENLQQAEHTLTALKADDETLNQRMRDEELRVEELRLELERLQSQESLLPPEQQRLAKTLEQQRQLLSQRELAFQQCQLQKETKLAELDKGCTTYQRLLALEFERMGEERLRLTFTNVDERAPSRAFSFQVFVDALDRYHIENCEPHLESLPELTEALNQTNDFSSFVRGVRREFKKLTT